MQYRQVLKVLLCDFNFGTSARLPRIAAACLSWISTALLGKKMRTCQHGPKRTSHVFILKYLESDCENKQEVSVVSRVSFLVLSNFCNSVNKLPSLEKPI